MDEADVDYRWRRGVDRLRESLTPKPEPKSAPDWDALYPFLALPIGLFEGVAIMLTWNWFVAGWFHVRAVDYWEALGLNLAVNIITHDLRIRKGQEPDGRLSAINQVGASVMVIVLGFIIHHWIQGG